MNREIKIPDMGEAADVEVIEICVSKGDEVAQGDALIVLESDKASMEVPAPWAGKVFSVAVALGDKVEEGTLVLMLEGDAQLAEPTGDQATPKPEPEKQIKSTPASEPVVTKSAPVAQPPVSSTPSVALPVDSSEVYAGPSARRLARQLGVDLTSVHATGARGRILKEDIKAYVKQALQGGAATSGENMSAIPAIGEVDFSRFGPVDSQPVSRLMLRGAKQLHASWLNLPQVTNHEEVDVTNLDAFRREQNTDTEKPKLTLLPFIMKACASALLRHSQLNGSFADGGQTFVKKLYVHLGMAVDTKEGLIVPVIRNVDQKGIYALAQESQTLAQKSRTRKLKPEDLQGGSFTISSLGVLGGTGFTPIVNAPQVAILGVARSDIKPIWQADGSVQGRLILPLSLSYDHRAVNGADAGRFLADLKACLEDIGRLLLY